MSASGDLVARAVLGEADALAALAREYRPAARRIALGILGDGDAAEDVAQDAMIRLQASLPGFRGDAQLGTWIHRVTLNLAYDHLRRASRHEFRPIADVRATPDPKTPDPLEAVDSERAREALEEALERLPEDQRRAVVLRFVAQLSYAEIAHVTGAAPGTVASRIFRALRRLGTDLEPKHLEILR